MSRITPGSIRLVLLLAVGLSLTINVAESADEDRPNILVVLCDDLGYGDVGCFGNSEIETPNIDRFAAEGMTLTDCYAAAANCSPARTGMMTGRTPNRAGVYSWIPFLSPMHLKADELTVATLLRDAGYDTCHSGKWGLNGWFNLPGQPQPSDHGFNDWFSTQNNALPNHHNPYNFVHNGIPCGPLEGYSAKLVVDHAIHWLTETRNPEKPFFMFVCFHEPHEPIATDPAFAGIYNDDSEPSRRAYHGNVSQMDAAFGRLVNTMDEQGLREKTLIFFTSDNGPARTSRHPWGSSGPFRMKKGHVYEGGIRVPGIIRWPGVVEPGSTSDVPISGVDLLPTACALAGISPPADHVFDGVNFLPMLRGEALHRKRPLYWQFNYARSHPRVAIRVGDWKLLAGLSPSDQGNLTTITSRQMDQIKSATLSGFELYNLRDDYGETTDLSQTHPQKLAELKELMQQTYSEVVADGPVWPEWTWPRYESQRIVWPDYPKPKKAKAR